MRPQRRYVRFKFDGYMPCDLAIQCHMVGKDFRENMVGSEPKDKPTEYYEGDYEYLKVGL